MFLEFRCVEIAKLAFKVRMVEFTKVAKVLSAKQVRIGWARQCATVEVDTCCHCPSRCFRIGWARQCATVGEVDTCCHCPSRCFSLNSRQTKSSFAKQC